MRKTFKLMILVPLGMLFSLTNYSQCETWIGADNETEASDAHVIYRTSFKAKSYKDAFENWKKAYELAPAADGQRASHYMDGIVMYKEFLKTEADETKKAEYKAEIIKLYDQAITCFESRAIKLKCASDECLKEKIGQLQGRKGYDMYYTLNSKYSENLQVLEESVNKSGAKSEYSVLMPYAAIAVYQFKKGKI